MTPRHPSIDEDQTAGNLLNPHILANLVVMVISAMLCSHIELLPLLDTTISGP
jgi:hypothetical protein